MPGLGVKIYAIDGGYYPAYDINYDRDVSIIDEEYEIEDTDTEEEEEKESDFVPEIWFPGISEIGEA